LCENGHFLKGGGGGRRGKRGRWRDPEPSPGKKEDAENGAERRRGERVGIGGAPHKPEEFSSKRPVWGGRERTIWGTTPNYKDKAPSTRDQGKSPQG